MWCGVVWCDRGEGSAGGSAGRVQLRRVADHFLFTVEASGSVSPEHIVTQVITPHALYGMVWHCTD